MKRTFVVIAGLATLAAVYFGSRLFAQQPGVPSGPAATKVGVCNIGTVFTKYKKALVFKEEMERELKPYKDKIEELKNLVVRWQNYMAEQAKSPGGIDKAKREEGEKTILNCKRQMEDLDREARGKIGKKNEEQISQLYKEVNAAIQRYALSTGYHMVLGYGEPLDQDLLSFMNINRKMQAMDMGAVIPMYVAQGLDVTEGVVGTLNAGFQGPATGVTPTGFTQPK